MGRHMVSATFLASLHSIAILRSDGDSILENSFRITCCCRYDKTLFAGTVTFSALALAKLSLIHIYFIYARQYVLSHTDGYEKLLGMVPDLEMNSAGFAGSGLDGGTLDHFDNTGGGQILHNSHDLTEFLKPGVVIPPVDGDRDTVYAGAGNDIVFGDHVHYVAKRCV